MNKPSVSSIELSSRATSNYKLQKIKENAESPRILIFIGHLLMGGKERRLVELLNYFKANTNYTFLVVMMYDLVYFDSFKRLDIPIKVIKRDRTKSLSTFIQFYKVCKQFNPHLIHTWGQMQTFYALPAVIGQHIPLINSQITSAPSKPNKALTFNLINWFNFHYSKVILANSKAGHESFNPPVRKRKVIYNGINLDRFKNLPDPEKVKAGYGINTPYVVVMVASYSSTKDYGLFYKVAEVVTGLRSDVTFLGVGGTHYEHSDYDKLVAKSAHNDKIIFNGMVTEVEALVNSCTIGVLFSVDGEGFSNSIMEYMALGKPVIANNAGGTKELVQHNENGYLIGKESAEEIADMIINLIDDQEKYKLFCAASRKIIKESFSLEKMGKGF